MVKATLVELEKELGPLPETLTQRTGGGGKQLFFRYPHGRTIKNSAGKNGKGLGVNVDIRAEGGQVVVPPSIHPSGAAYTWITKGLPPADMPPAWIARMEEGPAKKQQATPAQERVRRACGELPPYVKTAIDAEVEEAATALPNTRNHTLNRSAFALGQWVGGGYLSESEAERLLFDAAARSSLVADDGERPVYKTISSGLSSGMKEPRHAPEPTHHSGHAGAARCTSDDAETEQESRILPPPPPVPLEAFPLPVAAMLKEAAEAFTVPMQIPAACFLSLLSCLVGRSRLL